MSNINIRRHAITIGDPAGIGPEIVLRLFVQAQFPDNMIPFVVGDAQILQQVADELGLAIDIEVCESPPDKFTVGQIVVCQPLDFQFEEPLVQGKVSAACGAAAWAYIRHAVGMIQRGEADTLVTAPIQKEALYAAGCGFTGHTTMLSDLCDGAEVTMLLAGGGLRVALATIHKALAEVPALLDTESLTSQLQSLANFLPLFGLDREPRIAVCGLNPHAGEGGLFGDEESRIIAPAVAEARRLGLDVVGPLPADTVFHFHREGKYDAVLAMYHDQGLIPVKTLDFHGGVNVTIGLPFIRTSVDHGTAFDIAGQGIAQPTSLCAALNLADLLCANRSTT